MISKLLREFEELRVFYVYFFLFKSLKTRICLGCRNLLRRSSVIVIPDFLFFFLLFCLSDFISSSFSYGFIRLVALNEEEFR